jgi:pilus assembly protein CpaC
MNPACTTEFRGRHRSFVAALVVFIIVILVAAPQAAQQPPASFASNGGLSASAPPAAEINATDIDLLVGRSTILNVGATITRVSLTVPDIADAIPTTPTQLLIHGKQPGTISLFVWDRGGAIRTYEVNVRRDLKALKEQVTQLFPGEPITIVGSGKDVVLSGTVSTKYVIEKAADVASGYVEKKENIVNLLQQQEGVASNQVMLRVRFAEVSRSALTELGASWYTGAGGFHDYVARVTTEQFAAPNIDERVRESLQGEDHWGGGRDTVTGVGGKTTFSDFLNLFLFNNKYNVGTLVRAMQEKGLFQSLAEPNLIATNGKEASFLAGGEYPYPVVQPGGTGNSVTIMFKEFGIRLSFTPTVLGGDLINLKVKPEVSALDFSNAITLEGFRIPALSTRRTETEVELRDGQTFAIAGLLNNTVTDTMRKIPGVGDIPILGWLFKSKAMQKQQTELVVMITPTIVRRGQMGVSEGLPSNPEPFLGAPSKTLPPPAPYVGSPRYPAPGQPAPRGGASAPSPAPQPVARPIQGSATLPQTTIAPDASPSANTDAAPAPVREPVASAPPSKEELKAAERARIEDAKRFAEEQKAAAEQAKKDAEAKRKADKVEKERAAREAEVAKKKAEQDAKREKALADAAARLKAAQAEYQAEIEKAKGGANDKTKTSGKVSPSSTPKS